MQSENLVSNLESLNPEYSPSQLLKLESQRQQLQDLLDRSGRNLLIYGPHGSGKTGLIQNRLKKVENTTTCYLSCRETDTEYRALRQIYYSITEEDPGTGLHSSDIQRKLRNQAGHRKLVIVLDDVEFLLLNDGDDLLYTLTRLENSEEHSLVLVSSTIQDLEQHVEERTLSSLQPRRIELPAYTEQETFDILGKRAQDALEPQTLHRNALTYISRGTRNIAAGLTWLSVAARHADQAITEETVRNVQTEANRQYAHQLLKQFTQHHNTVYNSIRDLLSDQDTVTSGPVYERYLEHCRSDNVEALTDRRISDFLKHIELLGLIKARYYYGGQHGKTRKIQLNEF